MLQEKRDYDPEGLARRLALRPINIAETRDGIAQSLVMRWSQAHLALEAFRLQAYEKTDVEGWLLNHKLGRAFYHYVFSCHNASKLGFGEPVTPTQAGFEAALGACPGKHKTAYRRMMNDWLDNDWIDEAGKISEEQVVLHAKRVYEAALIPACQTLNGTMSSFLTTFRNEKMDNRDAKTNVLQLKKLDSAWLHQSALSESGTK